ncbi:MAG: OPT/YSL family transporter [Gemmatimonadaceae bacterium]|nr:OPT/YSL family transporter [Gemmatimonadaceae bacterium]
MSDSVPTKPAHIREFTPRSVAVGILVAVIIGASYPYVVLKFGIGPNISVVSAFFGFLALGIFSKSYNRWENNVVQTAGTSAGMIAFLCWLLAAFDILAAEPGSGFNVHLSRLQTWLWLSASGILGVLLAVPLRKHFIDDEKLPFPDGIAAGETLIMLDSHGSAARKSTVAMIGSLIVSGLVFFATQAKWIIELIAVQVNRWSSTVGLGFALSLLNVGSGMIIGLRITTSMLIGAVIAWVLAPQWLADHGYIGEHAKRTEILLTVMWPGIAVLIAGGITTLLLRWRSLVGTFKSLAAAGSASGDMSLRWVWIGCLLSGAALVGLQAAFFGTPVWQSVIAILLAVPLGLVALRVLGETNWGPISTMANLTQAVFGALAPGSLSASMVSSGVTSAVAAESEGIMQDYKVGSMIGSTPKILTYMQLIAVPVGALALAYAYPLLRDTYGLIGDTAQLSSPISARWVGFAKIVTQQLSGPGALSAEAMMRISWMKNSFLVGSIIGVLLTLLEQKKSWKPFVPSPTGMGIGVLIPISAVTVMWLGAAADRVWEKTNADTHTRYSIATASGFIAGEAIVAVIIPILVTLGLMKL